MLIFIVPFNIYRLTVNIIHYFPPFVNTGAQIGLQRLIVRYAQKNN